MDSWGSDLELVSAKAWIMHNRKVIRGGTAAGLTLGKVIMLCLLGLVLFSLRVFGVPPAGKYYGVASGVVECPPTASRDEVAGQFALQLKLAKNGALTGTAQLTGVSAGDVWKCNLTLTDLKLFSTNTLSGSCEFKVYAGKVLTDQGWGTVNGSVQLPTAMLSVVGTNAGGCVFRWTLSDGREYYPLEPGNTWRSLETSGDANPTTPLYSTEAVWEPTNYNGQAALPFTQSYSTNCDLITTTYRAVDDHGLCYLGNDDPTDPVTSQIAPYWEARLPVKTGLKWTMFHRNGVAYGDDLDGDGLSETANVQGQAGYGKFESVQTPVGRFENCLRLDSHVKVTVKLSGLHRSVSALATESRWFARGIGPVRSVMTIGAGGRPGQVSTSTEELTGYLINGSGRGVVRDLLLATNLAAANSDTENPGAPAIASDGTNFLVVTTQDQAYPAGLVAILLDGYGRVLQQIPLTSQLNQFSHPALAFQAGRYLLTWNQESQIYAAFLSPDGEMIDGPFRISDGTGTQFGAQVAVDGERALVVWAKYKGQYDVVGVFVSPDGTFSPELPICAAPGEQVFPEVLFAGTNYLAAWRDTRSGSGPAADTDIYGTRITPAGLVLDPGGFPLVTTTNVEQPGNLATDGQGRVCLVWSENGNIRARRFTPDGESLDGPVSGAGILVATNEDCHQPTVQYDGTNFLIAYAVGSYFPPKGIYLAQLNPADGTVLNAQPDGLGLLVQSPAELTERFMHPVFVRGNGNILLVWADNRETMGEFKSLAGALIYPF